MQMGRSDKVLFFCPGPGELMSYDVGMIYEECHFSFFFIPRLNLGLVFAFLVQHAIRLGYFVWGPPFAIDPAERFFLSLSSLPCVCPRTYQEARGEKISWIVFLN